MSEPDERETLADPAVLVLLVGVVNSREGWSECECGAHLPTVLDSDGYAIDEDAYGRVMAEHRADMLLASEWLAEHDRRVEARALRKAAEVADSAVITGLETTRPDHVATWLRRRADRLDPDAARGERGAGR